MGVRMLVAGSLFALIAVACGAFGAHALRDALPQESRAAYQTAVAYQFYHALGLLVMGVAAQWLSPSRWLPWAATSMAAGVVFFSGSLYVLAITGWRTIGIITPIGGLLLIAGWAFLAVAALAGRRNA
jgi:uncharacterized membrane protein YgdD (TMEM256/DUF423 family)